jgi:hypothetical protein
MRCYADRLQHGEVDEVGSERHRRAFHLVGGAGVVAQRRTDAAHVAERLLHRLTDVERLQQGKPLRVRLEGIGELHDQPSALGRCEATPFAALCAMRGLHRGFDVAGIAA